MVKMTFLGGVWVLDLHLPVIQEGVLADRLATLALKSRLTDKHARNERRNDIKMPKECLD